MISRVRSLRLLFALVCGIFCVTFFVQFYDPRLIASSLKLSTPLLEQIHTIDYQLPQLHETVLSANLSTSSVNPLSANLSTPSSNHHEVIHTARKGSMPTAFNPLDPTTQYKHHPIISEYDFVTARKNKDHLLDWLGTWIDYKYDCLHDTDPVGFTYKLVVPSRRIPCDEFYAKIAEPSTRVEGTLPVIDDEYPEYIDMLQSIKRFNPMENRPFVMVEYGARYGTWSVRAAVAFKHAFPGHQYVIVGVELAPLFCQWMNEHAAYNDVKILVVCKWADADWILNFMSEYSKVDIMDFDIQGFEFDILRDPRIFPEFREKLVSLHIGTHGDSRVPELIANAKQHGFYIHMMYPSMSGLLLAGDEHGASMCEDEVRRFSARVQSQKCKVASPVGPIYIRDGLVGCRNLKFWDRKDLEAEAAGSWKWVQVGFEHFLG